MIPDPHVKFPVTLSVPPTVALLVIAMAVPADENVFVPDKVGTADTIDNSASQRSSNS